MELVAEDRKFILLCLRSRLLEVGLWGPLRTVSQRGLTIGSPRIGLSDYQTGHNCCPG